MARRIRTDNGIREISRHVDRDQSRACTKKVYLSSRSARNDLWRLNHHGEGGRPLELYTCPRPECRGALHIGTTSVAPATLGGLPDRGEPVEDEQIRHLPPACLRALHHAIRRREAS